MNRYRSFIASLFFLVLAAPVLAAELVVENAWIREGPPNFARLAGYLSLQNVGTGERIVIGASSDDFEQVEIHRTLIEDDVARMVPVEQLKIPAGGRIDLKPGADHLMLIGPTRRLVEGDKVKLILRLEDGSALEVEMPVKRPSAMHGHSHNHGH